MFEARAQGEPGPPDAPVVASLTEFGASSDPRTRSDAPSPPHVVDYGPEGTLRSSGLLYVRFDQPMDTRSTDGIQVKLDPSVEMKASWSDPYRLLIEPQQEFRDARAYTVTIDGEAASATGETVPLSLSWTLETERPAVTVEAEREYWNDDDKEHWKTPVSVYVSHGVRPRELKRAVSATAVPLSDPEAAAVSVPVRFERREKRHDDQWLIRPKTHWPTDSEIHIEVGKDLVGKRGPLPSGEPVETSFQTVAGLTAELTCWEDHGDGCGPSWMTLNFSHPVTLRQLEKRVRISPRPKTFEIDSWANWRGEHTAVTLQGEFQIGQTYRIWIADGLRDTYGQPMAGKLDETVAIVPPPPNIDLHPAHGIIPHNPDVKPFVGIEARYLESATLESVALSDAVLARILSTDETRWSMPKTESVGRQTLDPLPREGEYEWTSIAVDLEPILGAPMGAALLRVTPGETTPAAKGRPEPTSDIALVQVTNLGAVAGLSASRSMIRVSNLETGAPVAGAHVTLHPPVSHRKRYEVRKYGPSGDDGVVWLPSAQEIPDKTVAIVRKGDDRFGLSLGVHGRDVGEERVVGAAVTDRKLYQPGDRVRVMGWAAMSTATTDSALRALDKGVARIELRDRKGRVLSSKSVAVKPYGKFWSTFRLPADGGLGTYRAIATLGDQEFPTNFEVREFRTPTFEVEAAVDRSDVVRGEAVRIDVNANYLYGKTTPLETARETHSCNATSFLPPDRMRWSAAQPEEFDRWSSSPQRGLKLEPEQAEQGHVDFMVATEQLAAGATHQCSIDVAVQDPAYEELGDSATYLVHPPHYLMLGPGPGSLRSGDSAEILAEAVDRDGGTVDGGQVSIVVERVKWEARKQTRTKAAACRLQLGSAGANRCKFRVRKPGSYEITLRGTVEGAEVVARRSFHVWEPYRRKSKRKSSTPAPVNEHPHLALDVPGTAEAGETIAVAVDGRQPTVSGFVTGSHAGVRWLKSFELADHEAKLDLPVTDAWIPTMSVDAFVTEGRLTTKSKLPTIESTRRQVSIPADSRRLEVDVEAPETAAPGRLVTIGVDVDDLEGKPVDAHVTVWAVDEAVMMLEPLRLPDLVARFAVDRGPESWFTNAFDLMTYPYVPRNDPFSGLGFGSGYGTGGGGAGFGGRGRRAPRVRQAKAQVRREFDAAPIFLGDVSTGPDGRAEVRGKLPDNLTTFRVMAVASAALPGGGPVGRFGEGETRLQVTSKLTLQPLLPRVLRPGDQARLAGLVANLSGEKGSAEVSIEIDDPSGVLRLRGPTTATVKLDHGGQSIVPFEVRARRAGDTKVRLRAKLTAGDGSVVEDAVEIPLSVEIERTMMQRSAVYGSVVDDAAAIELRAPTDVAPGSGSVEVSLHGSLLTGYLESAEDLVQYPYGCVEQTSSKMVPLIALRSMDVTESLGIEDLKEYVAHGISRLESMQTSEGGFGYWPGATRPHLYATAYATWVLSQADAAGLDVPDGMLRAARNYLRRELENAERSSTSMYDDIRMAMALHALSEEGSIPEAPTEMLWKRHERMPTFAKALLLMALDGPTYAEQRSTLTSELLEEIDEREAYARTRAPRLRYGRVFDSPVRTDSMVLLALIEGAQQGGGTDSGDLVEKLARGLARSRDAGQLRNTQENAYALLAMASYARLREAIPPDFMARAWVGPNQVAQGRVEGRRSPSLDGDGSLPHTPAATTKVTVTRKGEGRLYYRVGMNWAPAKAPTEPQASGLILQRSLRTSVGGKDVTIEPGTEIGGGQLVAMDIELSTGIRRGYVAVEIPLPAGLEAVDMSIGRGRSAMRLTGSRGGWVNHEELRHDRVVLFADDLLPGQHRHTVFLRATTPGQYRMPPARAESMYYPEVYGHTAGTTVVVR